MLKILDIGSGAQSVAALVFADEEKEITRLDANSDLAPDVVHDITTPLPESLIGQFDIVYCSHVMEHIDRIKVLPTLQYLSKALKDRGELWVVVPSLEWAAREIIRGHDGLHIQGHIFGGQNTPWDYHRTGFTLSGLRQSLEVAGLVIRKSYQSPFQIETTIDDQKKIFNCIQNVAVGARVDGFFEMWMKPKDEPQV
jgi:SAM-dependent methyltransferase